MFVMCPVVAFSVCVRLLCVCDVSCGSVLSVCVVTLCLGCVLW